MDRTFEEIVSDSLDELYRGALYLSAGDPRSAEELLADGVRHAARAFRRKRPSDAEMLLEEQLVAAALRMEADAPSRSDGAGELRGTAAQDGLRVFGVLPAGVRSAVWLVVVRRRAYSQVASMLGVDRDRVSGWIRDGHRAMHATGAWESWKQERG